ncbi:acyl-coenzyme A dehydrogenase [Spirochaetota bacterium]|nr:acyl-coenzyme A dehydrogenase [Spirochaetota bacterium]
MSVISTFFIIVLSIYAILLYNGIKNKWLWLSLNFINTIIFAITGPYVYQIVFEVIFLSNLLFAFTPLSYIITYPLLRAARALKVVPHISERERIALLSGDTWIEKDLFSGKPDISKILNFKGKPLTSLEKAFINGPVNKACDLANDFKIHEERDFPKPLWNYLKAQKFFGMIIPRRYGGLGFSAEAQSRIVQKIASRSYPLAVTVMVPNSLGPAELLLKYGTERQKNQYLNKLATGRIIPCFALTEPLAGSDASAIQSEGVLFLDKKTKTIKIRLNWKKRYITLAAIADVIGLAFQLKDPNHLLSDHENIGITCALIPARTKGVLLGRRHDPMGVPFYNCPTEGKNVIIGFEEIIGEKSGLGEGWKMLMECLAAGRGISLPGVSAGGSKLSLETVATYSFIRRQFALPIYQFEGIREKLAPIAGLNYIIESARRYTATSVDLGFAAPIVSAMMKYHTTEMARTIVNHTMDILGGAGISRGEHNLAANPYLATPIGITVEGANILTRSFIIFGQGLFRSHPHLYKELEAIKNNNLRDFSQNIASHLYRMVHLNIRTTLLFLTRGHIALKTRRQPLGQYKRKLLWAASMLAGMGEVAILLKGSSLKKSEMLNGHLGDVFSWLYLLTATIARYEHEKCPKNEKILFAYAMQYGFSIIENKLEIIARNIIPYLGWISAKIYSLNPLAEPPAINLINKVAAHVVENEDLRLGQSAGIFIPQKSSDQLNILRRAYKAAKNHDAIMQIIKKQFKERSLPFQRENWTAMITQAAKENIITPQQLKTLKETRALMTKAIEVDSFTLAQYKSRKY